MRRASPATLPPSLARGILGYLDARDVVSCCLTSRRLRRVAMHDSLWRELCHARGYQAAPHAHEATFTAPALTAAATATARHDVEAGGHAVSSSAAVPVVATTTQSNYWYLRYKRGVLGQCEVLVQSFSGTWFTVTVRATDDRWAVKRRVRAAAARVDSFALQDFELIDVSTGELFGVRGDSILPPNALPSSMAALWPGAPRGRVGRWLNTLDRRNSEWKHTMGVLVDGIAFRQALLRDVDAGHGGGGRGGGGGDDGGTGEVGIGAAATAVAAAAAGPDSASLVPAKPAAGVAVNVQRHEQVPLDTAIHRAYAEPFSAGACLTLLRTDAIDVLTDAARGGSVHGHVAPRPGIDADRALSALLFFLGQSHTLLADEIGTGAWKLGTQHLLHPLLRLALAGPTLAGSGPTVAMRLRAGCAWAKATLVAAASGTTAYNALVRAFLTWGSPALLAHLVSTIPVAVKRALAATDRRLGWWGSTGAVFTTAGEEFVDVLATLAIALRTLWGAVLPNVAMSVAFEVVTVLIRNTLRREGRAGSAAAGLLTALGMYAYGAVRKVEVWHRIRGTCASAVAWEALAWAFGPSRVVLSTLSAWAVAWWAAVYYVRLRAGLVLDDSRD